MRGTIQASTVTALPLHFAITKAIETTCVAERPRALVCVCAMPKSQIEIVRMRNLHARLCGATFSASVLSFDSAGFDGQGCRSAVLACLREVRSHSRWQRLLKIF